MLRNTPQITLILHMKQDLVNLGSLILEIRPYPLNPTSSISCVILRGEGHFEPLFVSVSEIGLKIVCLAKLLRLKRAGIVATVGPVLAFYICSHSICTKPCVAAHCVISISHSYEREKCLIREWLNYGLAYLYRMLRKWCSTKIFFSYCIWKLLVLD